MPVTKYFIGTETGKCAYCGAPAKKGSLYCKPYHRNAMSIKLAPIREGKEANDV